MHERHNFLPPRFYSTPNEFSAFHSGLKLVVCPHCRLPGFLILHGCLYGYGEASISSRVIRGHRIFCSNRKKRKGCGRTFSLLLCSLIKNFMIPALTLWRFLLNVAAGMSRLRAFRQAGSVMEISSAYRLFSRFRHAQSRIRTILADAGDSPECGEADPMLQTIRHLESAFPADLSPISSFQHRFQVSFL